MKKGTRKIRNDSRLDALSAEAQEAVFAFCEKSNLDKGVDWLRAEFDIEISKTRLGVWLEKQRADHDFAEMLGSLRAESGRAEIVARTVGDAQQMTESNVALLSRALFEAQRLGKPEAIKRAVFGLSMVIEAMAKDRKSKADVMTANTQREKFEFDAAKLALKHAAALQKINEGSGDERAKVAQAMLKLFGPAPQAQQSQKKEAV